MASLSRRQFIKSSALVSSVLPFSNAFAQSESSANSFDPDRFTRIATEETFATPEVYAATANYIKQGHNDEAGLGLPPEGSALVQSLMDLGEGRIADMDEAGINKQLLSLWSPGVQIFEPELGTELAKETNDQLAEVVRDKPDRFAGLVTIATQAPEQAALEIERGMSTLGLHGVLINSHTKSEFLDNKKYWSIFEAAQEQNAAIFIHPRVPSTQMFEPFADYQLSGAMYGFHVDASLHAIRLMLSGVFDEFPDLTIVLGHMGEGVPFWLQRLDDISARVNLETIKRKPSEYFRDNFVINTSGMFWDPILMLCMEVLGADRILFGVDHPFASNTRGTQWLDNAPLSDEEKVKIYQTNSERVFRL